MKTALKILAVVLFLTMCILCVKAQQPSPPMASVTVGWTASTTTNAGPMTYWLLIGTNSGTYNTSINCGTNLQAVAIGLERGKTYYMVATAQQTNGLTSVYSNETNYAASVLPGAPTINQFIIVIP